MSNKRNFTRVHSTLQATVSSKKENITAKVEDICLKGILLKSEKSFELDKNYNIEITFDDSEVTMTFDAKCIHHENKNFGFAFTSEDIDSFIHLRRYLELNSADGDLITRELAFLAKG